MTSSILVVDDEEMFLTSVRRALHAHGLMEVTLVPDPLLLPDILQSSDEFDVALIDLAMPGLNGMEVLALIKQTSPRTECIMITAHDNTARTAVECLKKGAYDYLIKPLKADDGIRVIERALERKRLLDLVELSWQPPADRPVGHVAFEQIITASPAMYRLLREAELHARSMLPILILGESGTGKELLARAIHEASSRTGGPFTPLNMAALTEGLFESAFFGHTSGAFTGAQKPHTGFLEASHGGTLFLDEIGVLPLELQAKLLRMLEEKEFIRLGETTPRRADVRFIAATNADVQQLMAEGRFRKDIYYRLRGARLHLPPLRERQADIPLLIEHFLKMFCAPQKPPVPTDETLALLLHHPYPGNVRELKTILQAALNLCRGSHLTPDTLPNELRAPPDSGSFQSTPAPSPIPLMTLAQMEEAHIRRVYLEKQRNLTHTAQTLGIALNTLRRKLRRYGLKPT